MKKYQIIYADPPWKYNDSMGDDSTYGAATSQYDCMDVAELLELPIGNVSMENSVLFCWATAPMLQEAMEVLRGWGFKYKTHFVWDKKRGFVGHYSDVRHELLIIATKGSCTPKNNDRQPSVIAEEKQEHSRKPDLFYGLIEGMYDGPYLELFGRRNRDGWTVWGNEVAGGLQESD